MTVKAAEARIDMAMGIGCGRSRCRGFLALRILAIGHILKQSLPVLLITAERLLEILQNTIEVSVPVERVPCGILQEPWIVLVAEVNRAAQPMQRFALIPLNREICSQPIGHFAVGLSSGKRRFIDKRRRTLSHPPVRS